MFRDCAKVEILDVSHFQTQRVSFIWKICFMDVSVLSIWIYVDLTAERRQICHICFMAASH